MSFVTPPKIFIKTNFEKVLEFNKAFGVPTNTTIQNDIFDKDPKLVEYRLSLIEEEVQELKDAIKQKDMTEILDSIGDILYVVYGAATAFGFDADKVFEIVQKSNMSKLCETEEDAIETVKRYMSEVPQRYDSPDYRRSDDGIHFVVYNTSTMKILKNYKYKPVDFSELLKN
jgi:predicted HAD superfamily Cof-like phosphohydrolase